MMHSKDESVGDTVDEMSMPNKEHMARAIRAAKTRLPDSESTMAEHVADDSEVNYDSLSADMVDHMRNDGGLAPELPHSIKRTRQIQDKLARKS